MYCDGRRKTVPAIFDCGQLATLNVNLQKIERILTIGRYVEMVIGVDFFKCIADQPDVGRVVETGISLITVPHSGKLRK